MAKLSIGWTTVEREEDALRLAQGLVNEKLAACVQVDGPIKSCFFWNDKYEQGVEYRLMVKFPSAKRAELQCWLGGHHPYQSPQWIVVEADEVAEGYAKWALEVTSK